MHIIFSNTNLDEKLYKKVTYKRGEVVFNSGDICNEIGFVEEGLLSIKTHTYTNDEYEISSLKENTCYGMFLLFSDDPHYLGTCIALKQTTVYIFTKDNLLKALQNTSFLNNYLHLSSNLAKANQKKLKILSQKSIQNKILFLLISNYQENGSSILKIKSKESLANYLCITRPSLSRELIRLKKLKIIDYSRNYLKLIKIDSLY